MRNSIRNMLRRSAALLLMLAILLTTLPPVWAENAAEEAYPNTWENTGDQAADIVGIALTQVGYQEEPDDHSKYNVWYYGDDTSLAWCSIFISWCADQAGIETWVMPKNNQAKSITVYNMEDNPFGGTAYAWGDADPQPGDILFTAPSGQSVSAHTALVYQVDENLVYTVEGNTKDATGTGAVVLQSYYRTDGSQLEENDHILFAVRPEYHKYVCTAYQEATCVTPAVTTYTCQVCGAEKQVDGTEPGAHSWDGGTLITPVTGRTDGAVQYTCIICGETREAVLRAGGGLFTDVQDPADWFYIAVNWAAEKRITAGTGRYSFSPELSCSRGQTVTMLWRVLGCPDTGNTKLRFADVPEDSGWYDAVCWAAAADITSGISETEFGPELPITRAQAVTMLWRAAGAPETGTAEGNFTDVSPDAYYAQAVSWAAEQGIISGVTETAFGPELTVTRAQLVTMLWRYAGRPAVRKRCVCLSEIS